MVRLEAEVNAPQDGIGLSRGGAGTFDIRILRTVEIRQAGPDSRAKRVAAGGREERVLLVARIRGQAFLFTLEEGDAEAPRAGLVADTDFVRSPLVALGTAPESL